MNHTSQVMIIETMTNDVPIKQINVIGNVKCVGHCSNLALPLNVTFYEGFEHSHAQDTIH